MSQILCLDIGNTNIYGGLLSQEGDILFRFRKNSTGAVSADEYGIFLRSVLKENDFDPLEIGEIVLCSVVPDITYSLIRSCQKYFNLEPFTVQSGVRTGLKILYKNPLELGADRIANAIAGIKLFPQRNIIIVDMGTATTFEAVSNKNEYLGGAIIPGLRISMESLGQKTARLPLVEIRRPDFACGRSTIESIQSGLYWEHLGAIKELVLQISRECFDAEKALVVATGGFSHLFAQAGVFDHIDADLVLKGMFFALQLNGER